MRLEVMVVRINLASFYPMQARTAAFQFFHRQGLVDYAGDSDLEEFARASSPEEWRQKGRLFRSRAQYDVAAGCFERGSDASEAMACRGLFHAKAAKEARNRGADFKLTLQAAAAYFLETGRLSYADKAAKCLLDKRLDLQGTAARVLDALAVYAPDRYAMQAARVFGRADAPSADIDRAFNLYWKFGKQRRALRLLVREHRYRQAIDTLRGATVASAAATGGASSELAFGGYTIQKLANEGIFYFSNRIKAAKSSVDDRKARDELMCYLDTTAQLSVSGL
jgi:hypothetical protein